VHEETAEGEDKTTWQQGPLLAPRLEAEAREPKMDFTFSSEISLLLSRPCLVDDFLMAS